jgi:hypothetical protein
MKFIVFVIACFGSISASAALLDLNYNQAIYSDPEAIYPNYLRMLESDGSTFFMRNSRCGETLVYRFDGLGKVAFHTDIFTEKFPCTTRNTTAFLRTRDGGFMYSLNKANQWNDGVISTVVKIDSQGRFVRTFGKDGKLPLAKDTDSHAPTKIIYSMNELSNGRILVGMNNGCGAYFSVLTKSGRFDPNFGEKLYQPYDGQPPCWEWPRLTVPFVVIHQNAIYLLHKRALVIDGAVYAAVTKWDMMGRPDLKYGERNGIKLIPLFAKDNRESLFNSEDSFTLASSGNFLFSYRFKDETKTQVIQLDPRRDFLMKKIEIQPPVETAQCSAGQLEAVDESANGDFFALINTPDKVKPKAPEEMCPFILQQISDGVLKEHTIKFEDLGNVRFWDGRPKVGSVIRVDGSNRVYMQIGSWQRTQPLN